MPSYDNLTILYGTQTGNAERLAFRIARMALKRGLSRVRVLPADDIPVEAWDTVAAPPPILFVTSNANQGDAPNTFRKTWARLLSPDCPSLQGLPYAVFGVGDSFYKRFNLVPKVLHNRLKQLGAQPLVNRGLGDESDAKGVDEALLAWLPDLWSALCPQHADSPPAPQEVCGAFDAALFPLFRVEQRTGESDKDAALALSAPSSLPFKERTFRARVAVNNRLTAEDHFQAVHHLELEPSRAAEAESAATIEKATHGDDDAQPCVVPYTVGDALGVYVPNRTELVDSMLGHLRMTGDEVVVVTPDTSHGLVEQTKRPFLSRPMTSRTLLTHYFDLDAVATQECFWMLAECCSVSCFTDTADESAEEAWTTVRERLMEIATNINEYLTYAHREKRNLCEVLFDFAYLRPPLELVLSFLPPMLPRYFSLSSSPKLDGSRLHLTVAQLAWTTPLKRQRSGLCSTQLVQAAVGSTFTCYIWEGTLTPPPSPLPLCLVATGTGIAPLRSMIRQCVAEGGAWANTPIYLFFGCRNAAKDFLYADEWASYKTGGQLSRLEVIPAFSRDTERKVYVQHQIGQHARTVATLFADEAGDQQPTLTYVCGNAKSMPSDVLEAIIQCCAAVLFDGDEQAARELLTVHSKQGRYQMDTWSA